MKKKRTRREEAETMKNFIEEDKHGIFATKTKRRTFQKLEQRGVRGRPPFGAYLKGKVLDFFKGGNKKRRRRVPNRGAILKVGPNKNKVEFKKNRR